METLCVEELEDQRTDVMPKHKCISPGEFRRLEERLDEMQTSILATNKMLRELSTTVHRQHQVTVSKTKNRRLSDSASPSMLALEKPMDTFAGMDVLKLESPAYIQESRATIASDAAPNHALPNDTHAATSHHLLKKLTSVFGAVAALIASIDENEAAYSKKIISTSERCRFLGISEELSKRIRGYYENLWRETKSVSADADAFINELSPALICEVKFQLYRDMLKRIPFLSSKTLAPAVIEVLVLHLRTVIYMQDDVLIRKDEFGDWMGFIGSKGSVGVLDPNSEIVKIIHILHKGEYFGEMALLQHTRRSATAIALTWVQIHVLCRQDLDYVKELYPTQAEILQSEIAKYKQWSAQHSK
ncbi:hypothetical protein PC113_g10231 [Phytophthora cactorum]|uniref:Cyclic nucleotide-binding domain-containing protein n=1 Tax=Phytophthora cactorum TaxID=29920 RepID=A0A8T1CA25_9STRA|nr:hypothetical protein PC113_g10231 [Phytophthora cactorum]KAG2920100.1 hypothetical protein PC115_g9911 [Phytophthora cactorum]KAG3082109.1 hypothetical protein PC121_g6224 [Phytophthora cactorum]